MEGTTRRVKVPYKELLAYGLSRSRAEHEEFCLKKGRPLSKPKYYLMMDREEVP